MAKEDRFGLLGIVVCAALASIDDVWRPFWTAGGLFLGVWTGVSLWRKSRTE